MVISKYIILFALCSVFGWVFESVFAIIKTKAWDERGFLYGPVCPIYGVGVVSIVLVAKGIITYAGFEYAWWHIALVAFFGSMVLEYVVSWRLEQMFHAYWWDYSDMPLNINGRTCVPAACLFMLGGLAAVYIISPAWDACAANIPPLLGDILGYVIVAIYVADITLSVSALTRIQEQVAAASVAFHSKADKLTSNLVDKGGDITDRLAAERDRLADEVLQGTLSNMDETVRMALGRIQGFRIPERLAPVDVPMLAKNLLIKAKDRIKR